RPHLRAPANHRDLGRADLVGMPPGGELDARGLHVVGSSLGNTLLVEGVAAAALARGDDDAGVHALRPALERRRPPLERAQDSLRHRQVVLDDLQLRDLAGALGGGEDHAVGAGHPELAPAGVEVRRFRGGGGHVPQRMAAVTFACRAASGRYRPESRRPVWTLPARHSSLRPAAGSPSSCFARSRSSTSSTRGGFAESSGVLVAARLGQGVGAAMTLPAALSLLTTSFAEGRERNTALGAWAGAGAVASAVGVLIGGVLTEGPGWRWVMFVNPIACVLVLGGVLRLIRDDRPQGRIANFDFLGAVLATSGMLLLVFALVKAPIVGWGDAKTIAELAGALVLPAGFVVNERRVRNPLAPLSIFRINGLAYADATQLIAFAGFLAMFFFLTLYMQTVLHYSPIETGLAYLPVCFAIGIAAGVASQLL